MEAMRCRSRAGHAGADTIAHTVLIMLTTSCVPQGRTVQMVAASIQLVHRVGSSSHSFLRSFVCSFIPSFDAYFVLSFIPSFIISFLPRCLLQLVTSYIHSFVHSMLALAL